MNKILKRNENFLIKTNRNKEEAARCQKRNSKRKELKALETRVKSAISKFIFIPH